MPHHRKLTDTERRQIIAGRAEGTPATDLAHRFNVSRRAIYDTLRRAQDPGANRTAGSRTVTTRLSDHHLADFDAGLARRGITDRPAALRRLIGAADRLLMTPDAEVNRKLGGWNAELQRLGAAINQIARRLNEAKLRGAPLPYTAQDDNSLREVMVFVVALASDFNALWRAKTDELSREVDKALEGLGTGEHERAAGPSASVRRRSP